MGADADVVAFDPKTIVDRATHDDPAQYSEGIRYVLVNGTVCVQDGRIVQGAKAGQALRSEHSILIKKAFPGLEIKVTEE